MKKVIMITLALYTIFIACLMAASAILNIGVSIEPITTTEAVVTTLLSIPLIALGVLVVRKPE
jgi:hypothetical protein